MSEEPEPEYRTNPPRNLTPTGEAGRDRYYKAMRARKDAIAARFKDGDRFSIHNHGGINPYPDDVLIFRGFKLNGCEWVVRWQFAVATHFKNGRERFEYRPLRWMLNYANDPIRGEGT